MLPVASAPGPSDRLRAWFEFPTAHRPAPSADGRWIYLISNRPGFPSAYRIPSAGGPPVRFTTGTERVGDVLPSPAGTEVVVVQDAGGNERWALSLVREDGTVARAVTARADRIHEPGDWRDGERFVYRSNERDERFFDIYEVRPHREELPRCLRAEDATVEVAAASPNRILLLRAVTNIDRDLLLWTDEGETLLNPRAEEHAVFDADLTSESVYAATNPGREFTGLYRYRFVASTPEPLGRFPGDVERVRADHGERCLAVVVNDQGYGRLFTHDLTSGETNPIPTPTDGVIGAVRWSPDDRQLLFDLSSPTEGVSVYRSDRTGSEVRCLVPPDRPFPGPRRAPTPGRVRAEDGLEVPYWEFLPEGPPRATIVEVHGGPEAQARPQFQPRVLFLVGEGYRVLLPNVRGSLGYGRTYLHLDDVRRRMDSVRDLRDVVWALCPRERREGTGGKVGVIGGSYGGFMVLAALTTYPDLFDAGVDIVGISNFVTFLERTGPWRRRIREFEYGSLEHDREFLRSISPLFHADRIQAPLLVLHGTNDPRVPLFEAEQIVAELRRRNVPVELLQFGDEGHGLVRRENQLVGYGRAASFLEAHLTGRG